MEVKTKFNVGDEIWVIENEFPHKACIDMVSVDSRKVGEFSIIYSSKDLEFGHYEEECFASKKEVLDKFYK